MNALIINGIVASLVGIGLAALPLSFIVLCVQFHNFLRKGK